MPSNNLSLAGAKAYTREHPAQVAIGAALTAAMVAGVTLLVKYPKQSMEMLRSLNPLGGKPSKDDNAYQAASGPATKPAVKQKRRPSQPEVDPSTDHTSDNQPDKTLSQSDLTQLQAGFGNPSPK